MTDDKKLRELLYDICVRIDCGRKGYYCDDCTDILALFDAERELTKKLMFWAKKHVHDCEPKMFDQREPGQHCDDPDCAPCGVLCSIDTIEKARGHE